jgi:hypothetical protein
VSDPRSALLFGLGSGILIGWVGGVFMRWWFSYVERRWGHQRSAAEPPRLRLAERVDFHDLDGATYSIERKVLDRAKDAANRELRTHIRKIN